MVAGYLAAFVLLSRVLKAGMPIGVAYGVWGACGVALTAVLAAVLFGQPLTGVMTIGLVLIIAYALVIRWGIAVALDAKDRFARLTAAGLTFTIFFYVAINLLMVMGLAPVVGIPLPLVSYGGSAMLTVMLCLGILMSIDRNTRRGRRGLA